LGGPEFVADDDQAVQVAKLNLEAGKMAIKMSDFFSAYSFLEYGISYLPKGHWDTNYDLSLELFNKSASCALMNAEHKNLNFLLDQIMHNANCANDKFRAIMISITFKMWSGQIAEAIKMTTSTLNDLGEGIPNLITPSIVEENLKATKEKLARISDDTLLTYPIMIDPLKIEAMSLLGKLFASFSFAGHITSLPFIASKMIQISLESGWSSLSPAAFAHWSNYLALVENKFEDGYRYAKLALSLRRASTSCIYDGAVIFCTTNTKIFVEPVQSTIEFYLEGHKAAMRSGATRYATLCAMVYDMSSFWAGKNVKAVCCAMVETMKQVKFYNNLLLLTIILPAFQVAVKMAGETGIEQSDLINASGESSKERNFAAKLPSHILNTSFHGFYEAFIFRQLERAKQDAETFYEEQSESTINMSSPMFMREFYFGLVSFWIGREKCDKKWLLRGIASKHALNNLATTASTWNFENSECTYMVHIHLCFKQWL